MKIADNPEIRISDTQGMLYKLDLQYSRDVTQMYTGSICDCGVEIFSKVNDQAMTFP